jgi:hypothetical protein
MPQMLRSAPSNGHLRENEVTPSPRDVIYGLFENPKNRSLKMMGAMIGVVYDHERVAFKKGRRGIVVGWGDQQTHGGPVSKSVESISHMKFWRGNKRRTCFSCTNG